MFILRFQGSAKQYEGILHCVKTIARDEGASTLFKVVTSCSYIMCICLVVHIVIMIQLFSSPSKRKSADDG